MTILPDLYYTAQFISLYGFAFNHPTFLCFKNSILVNNCECSLAHVLQTKSRYFSPTPYIILCYKKATTISKAPVTAILSSLTIGLGFHILVVSTSGLEGSRKPNRYKAARVQFTKVDLCLAKGKPKDSSLDTGSGTILFEGSFDLSVFQWLSRTPVVHHQVFRFALCVEVKGTEFR